MDTAHTLIDGRYRVLSVLGTGAQGVVLRAAEPGGREIALKVLAAESPVERVGAALLEARLVGSLDHPNVVAIYDSGLMGGRAFVAMELVEGPSLAQVLASRRRLAPVDAVPLFEQIGAALACVHAAGIVHRDVKPDNVLLGSTRGEGVAKLVDFGVAAPCGRPGRPSDVIGTPAYMAPEQAMGGAADPRSDLYALGVLMFHALTGSRPFAGDDAISAAVNHLTQPVPSFHEVAPELDLPRELERIVRRCLEKDPDRRYPRADAVVAELAAYRRDADLFDEPTLPPVHPPRAVRRAPSPWLLGALAAAATAVGVLLGVLG